MLVYAAEKDFFYRFFCEEKVGLLPGPAALRAKRSSSTIF